MLVPSAGRQRLAMVSCRHVQLVLGVISLLCLIQNSRQQFSPADPEKLIAEGFFVFDRKSLDIYMKEEGNDLTKAKDALLNDFNFFLTDVNTYYASMKQYGLDLQLWIAAVQILDHDIFPQSDVINGSEIAQGPASQAFVSFLNSSQAEKTPQQYDFAILMTGYDIDGGPIDGVASHRSMCQPGKAYALVEASGWTKSVTAIARQTAIILGAVLDYKGYPYLMAIHYQDTALSSDKFKFSKGSARSIIRYLMKDGRVNCLLKEQPTSKAPNVTPDTYTGNLQSVNTVCERALGPGSFISSALTLYSNGIISVEEMCYRIVCKDARVVDTVSYVATTESTPCGLNKACKKGQCVYDSKANTKNVDPNCLWGDDPIPFRVKDGNCSTLVREPQFCASPENRAGCCASCEAIKSNIPGCPYGDVSSFQLVGTSEPETCAGLVAKRGARICNSNMTRSVCCKTCYDLDSGVPGCPYGDVSSFQLAGTSEPETCAGLVAKRGAQICNSDVIRSACCKTCHDLDSGVPGCPYGDVSSFKLAGTSEPETCAGLISKRGARICASNETQSVCCKTCNDLNTDNPRCPYGDNPLVSIGSQKMTCPQIVSTYAIGICSNVPLYTACCKSCASYFRQG